MSVVALVSVTSPLASVSLSGQAPCDIYLAAGTPCVAAHSTVRALYTAYRGPLYEVKRSSDGTTRSITVSASGLADSSTQDAFCAAALGSTDDPLSCFSEEPEAAKLPNVCYGGYDVKTEANTSAACAAKCLADQKCVQFVKGSASYGDPHACRLSYTCTKPTSFLAGFDGYQRNLTKAGCGLPAGSCTISQIFDQSGRNNHLSTAPAGGAHGAADNGANASALKLTVAGHVVYGALFEHGTGPGRAHSGTGYRCDNTSGVATGDAAETMYMVTGGKRYNAGCCFDYGNAETDNHADGKGAMEAVYWGNSSNPKWSRGTGRGPWVMADLENGLWAGNQTPVSETNTPVVAEFVTAMLKGRAGGLGLKGGDAASGALKTMYQGPRPTGYEVMKKQGAIILGIGGDNSDWAVGTFYEGVMTAAYSSDATDAAIHENIVSAGYGK